MNQANQTNQANLWTRTLISPAVLAYTLYIKFANWRNCIPIALFMLIPTFVVLTTMIFTHPTITVDNSKQVINVMRGYFASPLICMLIGYFFISDGFAGRKIISESESMALLFTRPITRFCYVMSKFCGGFIGTSLVFMAGFSISLITALCFGVKLDSVSILDYVTLLCNAATFTSLMVFLHCANPLIGGLTYFVLMGASGMGGMFTAFENTSNTFLEIFKSICLFISEWFGDLVATPINFTALISANFLDTYELAVFASNIAFFLLLACAALSIREFSYGSD